MYFVREIAYGSEIRLTANGFISFHIEHKRDISQFTKVNYFTLTVRSIFH